MSDLATETLARWQAQKALRSNWDLRWDDCARYICQRKGQILTKLSPGQEQNIRIYDSTAEDALGVFAAGFINHVMPAGEKWFRFDPKSEDASPEFKDWLDKLTDAASDAIYSSNFYLSVHEDLFDAGAFCTSLMLLEEGKRKLLNFINIPVGTFTIEEDAEGWVDTVIREWKWTARQAVQKWGVEKLGKQVAEAYKSSVPTQQSRQFTFLHVVEPRPGVDYRGGKVAGHLRPIRSLYICVEDKHVIEEDGYYEMPYLCSRLLRSNNEVYGRGPGMSVMAEIKLVNAMERDMLTAVEKMVNPPWLVPDDSVTEIDGRPDGITYWDPQASNGQKPEQLMLSNRIDLGEKKTDQKRERIRRGFYNDLFQLLSNAEEMKREKTAYEVQQMVAEKLNLFQPIFSRWCQEKLNPMLERIVGILVRNGKVPQPPPEAMQDGEYEISYTSKIALAIKASENQAFETMVQLVMAAAQLDPSAAMVVKWRDGVRNVARNVGMPSRLLRPDREIDQMMAAQQKAQAAAQAAQTAEMATRSAKNLGPEAQRQATEQLPQAAAAMG